MQAIAALLLVSFIDPAVLLPGIILGALQRSKADVLRWAAAWFVFGGAFHEMLMLSLTAGRGWWWPGFFMSGLAGFFWVWVGYGLIGRRRKKKV